MTEGMPKPMVVSWLDKSRVYLDEKTSEPYFIRTVETTAWNDYLRKYDSKPSKVETERVFPSELGLTKTTQREVIVRKRESDGLEERDTYYSMTLNYAFNSDSVNKYSYFKKTKSGKIFKVDLDSGVSSECGPNSEFVTRGKPSKLPENYLLKKGIPIFQLNKNGELELWLDPEKDVW